MNKNKLRADRAKIAKFCPELLEVTPILRPNQECFFVTKFSFVKALNFMHQLSKSHLCKNTKKKGLARSKNMH